MIVSKGLFQLSRHCCLQFNANLVNVNELKQTETEMKGLVDDGNNLINLRKQ